MERTGPQKYVADEFFNARGYTVTELPTGQGWLLSYQTNVSTLHRTEYSRLALSLFESARPYILIPIFYQMQKSPLSKIDGDTCQPKALHHLSPMSNSTFTAQTIAMV